jgi:hypothetical protein
MLSDVCRVAYRTLRDLMRATLRQPDAVPGPLPDGTPWLARPATPASDSRPGEAISYPLPLTLKLQTDLRPEVGSK